MASDEDYMSFLDKANQPPSQGTTASVITQQQQQHHQRVLKTVDADVDIPEPIMSVCGAGATANANADAGGIYYYTSDADEPFVPVALKLQSNSGGGLPDEGGANRWTTTEEFARLVNHWEPEKADIEIMDPIDWDSQGSYKVIIDAVRQAGKGSDVRVYRVGMGGVKHEYWVVTATEGKLVGAKALAVES
ncbi:hypothetical protein QBC46DRAFT_444479 [Diplogelasinospora grovesii]|uniref:Uncharacterized protein n=1 Tax=Diplogelasinospora grovesii TaxID=303347 RepID=A0AAN6NIC5_9PEZI|nr:hypothetical protein QBC46DRAFT_444479 [Diplogelasinospora grovesii]